MNIIIIGAGNIGSNIARSLIHENHHLTLIDRSAETVQKAQSELDALVICGDGAGIKTLREGGVAECDLLIAVADDDGINILTSYIAKRLNPKIKTFAKVKYYSTFFDEQQVSPADFFIDVVINPNDLVIDKIISLIDNPDAIEIINYHGGQVQLAGFLLTEKFLFAGESLHAIAEKDALFARIRVAAISRSGVIIIPNGTHKLRTGDKIYCVGKTPDIQLMMRKYFNQALSFNNVILTSEPKILPRLVERIKKSGRSVVIIEQDKELCKRFSEELDDVKVIHGYSTDASVIREVGTPRSVYVAMTDHDEFNIVASATAKNHGIPKAMCSIRDIDLVPILSSIAYIDSFFSANVLATGEILRYSRRGNINSVTYFSEISAEIIELTILDKIPILGKQLRNIDIPDGMIIASILRDEEIIIPNGDDMLLLNDKVLLFVLPASLHDVDLFFATNLIIGR